jgi:hypothetical protein
MTNRMIAYNGHETNDIGIIWCTVIENEAGYCPMTGSDPLAAPWYLARWDNFDTKLEAIEHADKIATLWNEERGHSKQDVLDIMVSSIRLGVGA